MNTPSDTLFRNALDNATDAIGMSTPDGRHYYQNRAFNDLFGVIGEDPPTTLYTDRAVGRDVFKTIMSGGTWIGEVTMYAADRGMLNILLRAYASKDEHGKIVSLVGIHTDITQRKRAEAALRESENRLRTIIDRAPYGALMYELDRAECLRLVGYNRSAERMLAVDCAPFVGQTIEEAFPPLADTELPARYAEVARTGAVFEAGQVEYAHGAVQGVFEVCAVQLAPRQVAAFFRDITERRQAEESRQRVHMLERLGAVAGGIAHDFNNLLMGVFGNIELARLELPPDHAASPALQDALHAVDSARRLTTRLLTFAKGGSPVMEAVDLRQGIRDTVRFNLAGSNVAARVDVPEDLWPAMADKGQLDEVIANLTLNAKEAMPSGGTLHICAQNVAGMDGDVVPELRGDFIKLTFRDEGPGISAENLDRIFDPYFTTKASGSGLGLAVVHSIVRKHKGHVRVDATTRSGTTFTVFLPVAAAKAVSGLTPNPAPPSTPPPTPPAASRRILLMDDEEMVRRTTARMLESLGYVVETVADGEEALDRHRTAAQRGKPFDLTIMDLTIPGGVGGEETLRRLHAFDPEARAIVYSGYSSDPVMADHGAYGFSGCLLKPFVLPELKREISRVLDLEVSGVFRT